MLQSYSTIVLAAYAADPDTMVLLFVILADRFFVGIMAGFLGSSKCVLSFLINLRTYLYTWIYSIDLLCSQHYPFGIRHLNRELFRNAQSRELQYIPTAEGIWDSPHMGR